MERGNFSFVSGAAGFFCSWLKNMFAEKKKLQIGQKVICKTVAVALNSVALLILARFSQIFFKFAQARGEPGKFCFRLFYLPLAFDHLAKIFLFYANVPKSTHLLRTSFYAFAIILQLEVPSTPGVQILNRCIIFNAGLFADNQLWAESHLVFYSILDYL